MDVLTQGLTGAALAQAGARPQEMRIAAGVGFAAGLLADADVLIQSASDPLLQVEYHRHFTHALFFVPVGALIATLLLWPFLCRRLPVRRLYLFSLFGYSLAGFLDVCTSYGTYWLWPLVDERLAFNIIAIVDPLFTLVLITAVAVALRRASAWPARAGLVMAAGYLLLGLVQHDRARDESLALASVRGDTVERMVVKPTLGNLVLWRSIYQAEGRFHVDAVRVGLSGTRVYMGESVPVFRSQDDAGIRADSVQGQDIERFARFSDGFMIRHPQRVDVLGDVRYAMLPTSVRPLWGIELDPAHPERHAAYRFYRQMTAAERQRFIDMLLGRDGDSGSGSPAG